MSADAVENAVDLEALQAQIDLSMALTDQLVSSWLPKSTANKTNKTKTNTFEANVQDALRRPPRLGVGAPLPEAPNTAQKEAYQLKKKLVGNSNNKRRLEVENENKEADQDEGDEAARGKIGEGSSSAKRIRLDPFSSGQRRGKAKGNIEVNGDANYVPDEASSSQLPNISPVASFASSSTLDAGPSPLEVLPANTTTGDTQAKMDTEIESIHTSQSVPMNVDSSQASSSSKKKRKRKKRHAGVTETAPDTTDDNHKIEQEVVPAQQHTEDGDIVTSNVQESEAPIDKPFSSTSRNRESMDVPQDSEWHGFESTGSDEGEDDLEESTKQINGTVTDPNSQLNGPAAPVSQAAGTETMSNAKKRRRRKKKSKAHLPTDAVTSST